MRTVTDPFPYPPIDYAPRLGPFLLGPNTEPENGVYCGDFFQYADRIPDNSIDLCFTDPDYEDIGAYSKLARVCARVLKPDSACLVWIATRRLPDILSAMINSGLSFRWLLSAIVLGPGMMYGQLSVTSQRCLWMEKGESRLYRIISDGTRRLSSDAYRGRYSRLAPKKYLNKSDSSWASKNNGYANWGKDEPTTIRWLNAFAKSDSIILDPFCGGGTVPAVCKQLGRRYLAFEIDKPAAKLARQRIRDTQPPLFTLPPEQAKLEFAAD